LNLPIYKRLLGITLTTQGLRFHSHVIDKSTYNGTEHVKAYNNYAGHLIADVIDQVDPNCSEYMTILADDVPTNSKTDNFKHMVRDRIRMATRRNALFGICRSESHAVSEIQLTDVLIGSVNYSFKMRNKLVSTKGAKAQFIEYLQQKLGFYF
jgi:hypothetical protein